MNFSENIIRLKDWVNLNFMGRKFNVNTQRSSYFISHLLSFFFNKQILIIPINQNIILTAYVNYIFPINYLISRH